MTRSSLAGAAAKSRSSCAILRNDVIGNSVKQVIVLTRVMPGDLVFVACHFHEDAAAQVLNEMFVVRELNNGADGLRSKPEADAHRASGQAAFQPDGAPTQSC